MIINHLIEIVTIYLDVDALSSAGVPISTDMGKGVGLISMRFVGSCILQPTRMRRSPRRGNPPWLPCPHVYTVPHVANPPGQARGSAPPTPPPHRFESRKYPFPHKSTHKNGHAMYPHSVSKKLWICKALRGLYTNSPITLG